MTRAVATFVIAIAATWLSGCTANKPKDLEVSSINKVGKNSVSQLVGKSIHESWIESDFVVIELSTKTDLLLYTKQKSYPLGFYGRFCDELDIPVHMFGLFSKDGSDNTGLTYDRISQLAKLPVSKDEGRFNYYVFAPVFLSKDLEIYGRPERDNAVFYKKYNLVENPRDLCFVVGGSGYGFGFKSNTAVLTKDSINKALGE